jgi:hypothetical protein
MIGLREMRCVNKYITHDHSPCCKMKEAKTGPSEFQKKIIKAEIEIFL